MNLTSLNLPTYNHRIIQDGKKTKIFDQVRKKFLVLTPEEWVRQNFVQYLIQDKGYPASLICIEKGLKVNHLYKRCDILIYNSFGNAKLLIECKSPSIKLSSETFQQVARYNISFKLPYLIVTNGMQHFCSKIDFKLSNYSFLEHIPTYIELNTEKATL